MTAQNMGIPTFIYDELRVELKNRLVKIIRKLKRSNFRSEDSYFIALFSALQTDEVKFGGYYLDFHTAKMTDRGPNSAESKYGCDFSFLVNWKDGDEVILRKIIIGQAKNEPYGHLSKAEQRRLFEQCNGMAEITDHYIVTFRNDDDVIPTVNLGTVGYGGFTNAKIPLDVYIIDKLLSCLHGETNPNDIGKMLNSKMSEQGGYYLYLETNLPVPVSRSINRD
ncbi:hypothetical protein [Serratia marcescens]|uniref:hypothetical protein n=1 Tax=Serratia marcescens TaxID=615 RepID=UPI0031727129